MEKFGVEEVWERVEFESGWIADVRQEIRENVEGDEGRSIDVRYMFDRCSIDFR